MATSSNFQKQWTFFGALVPVFFLFFLLPILTRPAWSRPTTAEQAQRVVQNWRGIEKAPFGAVLGTSVARVDTYQDDNGLPLYHVVYLAPSGLVIVSGDDLVEPIVAFVPEGIGGDPSPENPLQAMVEADLSLRIETVRELETTALATKPAWLPKGTTARAQKKWAWLQEVESGFEKMFSEWGISSVSDERVPPLVQSTWGQGLIGSRYCYSYYTPNHYLCGDVATAMAQLIKYHQYPTAGVGVPAFTIWVDGVSQIRNLRGGDGAGGAYAWALMALSPNNNSSWNALEAIGALTHDAGVSVNTSYTLNGSTADLDKATNALTGTFGYSNAVKGYRSAVDTLPVSSLLNMINPNLDGGYPVLLGLDNSSGSSHTVVVDGYGYNASTLYHHLNIGLSGTGDAWYNLPTVDTGSQTYTLVKVAIYNIFKTGAGEIISGRVVDENGNPIQSAVVTATITGAGGYSGITNSRGIYAILKAPSAFDYTVRVEKSGYAFPSQSVSTGTSVNNSYLTGNVWGVDFASYPQNDNFASAASISGASGQTTGSNTTATKESGEPNHAGNTGGKSVWWTWTAPGNGQVTLDTHGSSFDTLLAVYTGANVSSLTQVAANDDDGSSDHNSGVSFPVQSGVSYKIAVDGSGGASGQVFLKWSLLQGEKTVYDFNGDNKTDLPWRHLTSGTVALWLMNDTTMTQYIPLGSPGDSNWQIAGVGHFNNDYKADLLWRNVSTGENAFWLTDDLSGTSKWQYYGLPQAADTNWVVYGVGDFNGDNTTDILWRHQTGGAVVLWLINDAAVSDDITLGVVNDLNWMIVAAGDVNGDARADILWRHQTSGLVGLWVIGDLTADSKFSYLGLGAVNDPNWTIAGLGDFNGDARSDILWRNIANGGNAAWIISNLGGADKWQYRGLPTVGDLNWSIKGIRDYTSDHTADILWRHQTAGTIGLWQMSGGVMAGYRPMNIVRDQNWKIQ